MMDRIRIWLFWVVSLCFIGILLGVSEQANHEEIYRWVLLIYIVILWVFHLLPLPITGLLILGLVPLLGLMPAREAFALFGNQAVFFILGVFILASGVVTTGLADRMIEILLDHSGKNPIKVVYLFFFITALLACLMPEHAAAALVLPIGLRFIESHGKIMDEPLTASVVLSIAWGAVMGGIVTLLGGARAVLAIEITRMYYQHQGDRLTFSFLDWMKYSVPVFIAIVPAGLMALYLLVRRSNCRDLVKTPDSGTRRMQKPWTANESMMLVVYTLTVVTWITIGNKVGLGVISLCATSVMFGLGLVSWSDAQRLVNWGVVLLFGGAMVLGEIVHQSQVLNDKIHGLVESGRFTPWEALMITIIVTMLLTELMSNSACVALVLPIGLEIVPVLGVNPIWMMLAVAMPAGLTFILPTGNPPIAMAAASGYPKMRYMLSYGTMIFMWCLVVLAVWLRYWVFY